MRLGPDGRASATTIRTLADQYSENEIGRYTDHQMLVLSDKASVAQAQRFFRRIELDCNDNLFIVDDQDKVSRHGASV